MGHDRRVPSKQGGTVSSSRKTMEGTGGAVRPSSMSSGHAAQLQSALGNRAVIQMLRGRAGGRNPASGVIQRSSYKLPNEDNTGYDTYDKESYSSEELKDLKGSDGKFSSVQADRGLPTFYGALKRIFGEENVAEAQFKGTQHLGESCDRPHTVTANINMKTVNKKGRENGPLATAIGHFGYEELGIREGADEARAMDYNGGHLVGYQVLGGIQADQEWNIAPQDGDNNKFAYNNTIEEMARKATKGANFDYTVEINYKSLNFAVDQQQLIDHGYLKQLDEDKPWTIQLPTRIPQHWSAKAVMNGSGGRFGKPTLNNNGGGKKTYDQYSQELDSDLSHTDKTHTARYKLEYGDKNHAEIEGKDVNKKLAEVRSVHFRMHQEQPYDLDRGMIPNEWKGGDAADYGSVKEETVTAELVAKLREDILKDIQELKATPEEQLVPFDFNQLFTDALKPLASSKNKEQLILFAVEMQEREEEVGLLAEYEEEYQRQKGYCTEQKEKLEKTKALWQFMDQRKTDAEPTEDGLKQEFYEYRQNGTGIKRTKFVLDSYNETVKKIRLQTEVVKNEVQAALKEATGKDYKKKLKSRSRVVPGIFSQRLSNLEQQPFEFYFSTVTSMFSSVPVFTPDGGTGIKDLFVFGSGNDQQEADNKTEDPSMSLE